MYKKVYVEITNVCNLACTFCSLNKRAEKFMSKDEFRIILDKLKDHTKYLYFHVLGEPLMHPSINEFIDMASKLYFVNITTNGYLLEKIKENRNVRQINISLHSYNPKYGVSLHDYLDNILSFVEVFKKRSYVSFRLWLNILDKQNIIAYLEKYYKKKIDGNMKLDENVFIEFNHEFRWPNSEGAEFEFGTCRALKDHIAILVDGSVIPCCLDSEGLIKLGNIYENDIFEIQNSKRYQQMLMGFRENKKTEILCRHCSFYRK